MKKLGSLVLGALLLAGCGSEKPLPSPPSAPGTPAASQSGAQPGSQPGAQSGAPAGLQYSGSILYVRSAK